MSRSRKSRGLWEVVGVGVLALGVLGSSACRRRRGDVDDDDARRRIQSAIADAWDRQERDAERGEDVATSPADTPAPAAGHAASEPLGVQRTGGDGLVDLAAVARIIRGQTGGVRACFERDRSLLPTGPRTLVVEFTITPSGRAADVTARGLTPMVGHCVAGRIRGLVFPAPSGGSAGVRAPFVFAPAP
jgi:hypothetical protein